MNMRKLPLKQKTTIIAQKFLIAVATRINKDEVIISYINLENHEEVLRIREHIPTGSQIIKHVDTRYWKIYTEGRYLADFDLSVYQQREVKVTVTTYDRSLEIALFKSNSPSEVKTIVEKKQSKENADIDQIKQL